MNDDRIGKRELDTWRVIALDALREMYPSGPVEARAYAQELGTQCALDERERIVAWLKSYHPGPYPLAHTTLARLIERGEHLK